MTIPSYTKSSSDASLGVPLRGQEDYVHHHSPNSINFRQKIFRIDVNHQLNTCEKELKSLQLNKEMQGDLLDNCYKFRPTIQYDCLKILKKNFYLRLFNEATAKNMDILEFMNNYSRNSPKSKGDKISNLGSSIKMAFETYSKTDEYSRDALAVLLQIYPQAGKIIVEQHEIQTKIKILSKTQLQLRRLLNEKSSK